MKKRPAPVKRTKATTSEPDVNERLGKLESLLAKVVDALPALNTDSRDSGPGEHERGSQSHPLARQEEEHEFSG